MKCIFAVMLCISKMYQAVVWCCQRTCYPIKETVLGGFDDFNRNLNPWKTRRPRTHIPTFSY